MQAHLVDLYAILLKFLEADLVFLPLGLQDGQLLLQVGHFSTHLLHHRGLLDDQGRIYCT